MKLITENYQNFLIAIFILLIYGLLLNAFAFLGISHNIIYYLVEIFNKTSLGVGAILAGVGGLTYIKKWSDELLLNKEIELLRNDLSSEKYKNGDFKIIAKDTDKGKLFLWKLKSNTLHHIGNYTTYLDLHLLQFPRIIIKSKDFDKIPPGEMILTRGLMGT